MQGNLPIEISASKVPPAYALLVYTAVLNYNQAEKLRNEGSPPVPEGSHFVHHSFPGFVRHGPYIFRTSRRIMAKE